MMTISFYLLLFQIMSFAPIKVSPEVSAIYNSMKLSGAKKFVAFRIKNNKVVLDEKIQEGPKETNTKDEDKEMFDKLKGMLDSSKPRYILYEFQWDDR